MEKYGNGTIVTRRGGRYSKSPTLEELGYDLSDGTEKTCRHCGKKQYQIVNNWLFNNCNRHQTEEKNRH
jgi:hypothetical protein